MKNLKVSVKRLQIQVSKEKTEIMYKCSKRHLVGQIKGIQLKFLGHISTGNGSASISVSGKIQKISCGQHRSDRQYSHNVWYG